MTGDQMTGDQMMDDQILAPPTRLASLRRCDCQTGTYLFRWVGLIGLMGTGI
jgi:hypothetical protein